ncbi:MAG TPA: hypothetical protein VFF67_02805 [Thermoplasmata archaeon]|nr:hypothetical protein [Thermoplasmata archaeon]
MFPLVTFGAGCLVGALILLETHFSPGGSHFPFWALLIVNGSIATAGGAVVAYSARDGPMAADDSSEFVRIHRGDWEQIQLQLLSLRGREAPAGEAPPGAGWRSGPASERASTPAPRAPPSAPRPSAAGAGRPSAPAVAEPAQPAEPSIDSLLSEIETLSLPPPVPPPSRPTVRPAAAVPPTTFREPSPTAPAPPRPSPAAAVLPRASTVHVAAEVPAHVAKERPAFLEDEPARCARCHRELGTGPFDEVCSICREPICSECGARVAAEGHPGQCDVCARLVQDLDG